MTIYTNIQRATWAVTYEDVIRFDIDAKYCSELFEN